MIIAKVIGTMVSTVKNRHLNRYKLLIVQPLTPDEKPDGEAFMALDTVDAGEGDLVLVNDEGSGARLIMDDDNAPVRAVIVGVIDNIDLFDKATDS
ncbi:MAG: hypothetical protein AUJ47_05695 [Candidatus Marinimicrobia bacterium CG1_02_48_14]|nr:MAG: hypothetical protein AUJ47_05695 [Candidatus Marinimicrobia bacterium CG1_02_48_14]